MTAKERLEKFEEDAAILEKIAHQYGQESREDVAVRHAAIALWYVLTEGHERFQNFMSTFDGPLGTAEGPFKRNGN
jgi:hypothetical protein